MEHKTKSAASEGKRSAQNAKEIPERLDFGRAFLSQLILDVLRCEWNLIENNTHEYISAKCLADCRCRYPCTWRRKGDDGFQSSHYPPGPLIWQFTLKMARVDLPWFFWQ
jgi:hypothetical protein